MVVMTELYWGFVMSDVSRLCDELNDGELLRYSRQILLDGWDLDAQIRLKNSRVVVVGVGGLGCPVAQILARSGVGYLHLIDHDTIDDSNLQRQSLFMADDVGKPKVQLAYDKLKQHNELIELAFCDVKLTNQNIAQILEPLQADLVIDCTDNFAIRDLLNQTCRQLNLPLLSNSAIGEVGQIALFTAETGCYHCLFGGEQGDEQNCATSGVLSSTVSIIGSLTAQIALDYLGRANNPIQDQLLLWQGRTMSLRKLNFQKNPNCPICLKREP